MRAVLVIVADIIREQPFQMSRVDGNHVIQKISPTTSYPSLCDSVLPGTFERSAHTLDLHRPDRCGNLGPILGIPIEDQELARRIIWERFSQLLNDPIARRVPRDVEMQNAPTIMADDEKAVKNAESQRRNREEVHGGDRFSVIAEKCKPAFGWFGIWMRPAHPAGYRSLGNHKAEHEKLPMNPRCSPGRILGDHFEDQLPNVFRYSKSATPRAPRFRQQGPVSFESGSMPLNDGIRKHDDKRPFPIGPNLPSGNPKQFVEQIQF